MRPYKWLRMRANFLPILANFLRSLRLLNNQFAEFLVNPLRMLRILTNALANFANICERVTNETNTLTHAQRKPLPMFRSVTFIRQAILNSQDCFIRIIYFDSFTVTIWIPECYLFLIELLLVCFEN